VSNTSRLHSERRIYLVRVSLLLAMVFQLSLATRHFVSDLGYMMVPHSLRSLPYGASRPRPVQVLRIRVQARQDSYP